MGLSAVRCLKEFTRTESRLDHQKNTTSRCPQKKKNNGKKKKKKNIHLQIDSAALGPSRCLRATESEMGGFQRVSPRNVPRVVDDPISLLVGDWSKCQPQTSIPSDSAVLALVDIEEIPLDSMASFRRWQPPPAFRKLPRDRKPQGRCSAFGCCLTQRAANLFGRGESRQKASIVLGPKTRTLSVDVRL